MKRLDIDKLIAIASGKQLKHLQLRNLGQETIKDWETLVEDPSLRVGYEVGKVLIGCQRLKDFGEYKTTEGLIQAVEEKACKTEMEKMFFHIGIGLCLYSDGIISTAFRQGRNAPSGNIELGVLN